jgi:hypothetical protein
VRTPAQLQINKPTTRPKHNSIPIRSLYKKQWPQTSNSSSCKNTTSSQAYQNKPKINLTVSNGFLWFHLPTANPPQSSKPKSTNSSTATMKKSTVKKHPNFLYNPSHNKRFNNIPTSLFVIEFKSDNFKTLATKFSSKMSSNKETSLLNASYNSEFMSSKSVSSTFLMPVTFQKDRQTSKLPSRKKITFLMTKPAKNSFKSQSTKVANLTKSLSSKSFLELLKK